MHKFGPGLLLLLSLAALSYATLVAHHDDHTATAAAAQPALTAEQAAARDRMAQLVAEVAARSAAQTAKAIALGHSSPPPADAEKTATPSSSR
jgi:hypothetical protein